MNKNQIKIIDIFTELIVYTLDFKENSQSDIFSIDKLVKDYDLLIQKAENCFEIENMEFKQALFPIVSWIDEVVLGSKHKDKKLWRKNLLQKKFFNTSNAGYDFFEKLENLDTNLYELRLLYLYCLFLGFKGKYYKIEDEKKLNEIFKKQKSLVKDDFLDNFPKVAFRSAYAQSQLPSKKKFSTSYKGFWFIMFLSLSVALVLFLASQAYLNGLLDKYNIF